MMVAAAMRVHVCVWNEQNVMYYSRYVINYVILKLACRTPPAPPPPSKKKKKKKKRTEEGLVHETTSSLQLVYYNMARDR